MARQFINAVNSTTTVAAGNDHLSIDGGQDKLFTLTFQVRQFTTLHPLVYLLIAAYRTNKDGCILGTLHRRKAHNALEVLHQTRCSHSDSLRFGSIIADGSIL